jgi:hypothetical protein
MIKLSIRKTVMVAVAAGATIGLVATSAFAAVPTYKITAGSKTTGSANYTGKTTGSPGVHFTDKRSGLVTTCASATAAGAMKLGAHVSGTGMGSITKTTWKTCKGPNGTGLTLTPTQSQKWTLNGTARPSSAGVTKLFIGAVKAHVTTNIGCTFNVVGSASATYSNSTGKLTVASVATGAHVLKAANVTTANCIGQVRNGDVLIFKATYTVTTASGKIKIA